MAEIKTSIVVQENMATAFKAINNVILSTLDTFQSFDNAIDGTSTLSDSNKQALDSILTSANEATNAINEIDNAIKNTDSSNFANLGNDVNSANNEVEELNDNLNETSNNFDKVTSSSGLTLQSLLGFSAVQKIFSLISSQLDSAIERFDTLNNYTKVMSNLGISEDAASASMEVLSESLQGLPTTLNDAVSSVQRFTSANGNIASSTKMFLALNNALLAGGASTETQSSALEQLSQAYAKGTPDMMEWRSLMTAMPAQLNQIAIAMGYVDATALGEDLRAGTVSMNEFMETMIELNETGIDGFQSFEEQARNATGGFSTSIANMKSALTRGLTSMIDNLNNALENAGLGNLQTLIVNFGTTMENVLTNVGTYLGYIINILQPIFNLIYQIGSFVSDNWSTIAPIIMGIVGAMIAYNTILGIHALAVSASAIAEGIHTITTYAQAKALLANVNANLLATSSEYALAVATAQATVAQASFNTSLLACPITWIVIAIVALIAVLAYLWFTNDEVAYGILYAWDSLKLGIMTAGLGIKAIWYGLLIAIQYLKLGIQSMILGAMTAWYSFETGVDAVCVAILTIFQSLYNGIVDVVNGIIKVLNKIPGVSIDTAEYATFADDALDSMIDNVVDRNAELQSMVDDMTETESAIETAKSEYATDLANSALEIQTTAVEMNSTRDDRVSSRNDWITGLTSDISDATSSISLDDYDTGLENYETSELADDVASTADNTSSIADSMDITEEELEYLRDLAEQEVINRYTTASINIEMNNNNNINSDADIDGIVSTLEDKIYEMTNSMAEGVHS